MKIYLELPEVYLSNFNEVISYAESWRSAINGIFIPDLPLNKPTVDACALISLLREKLVGSEIIVTQSVGHRSVIANKSRMQCIKKMGVDKLLLVQGPLAFSKVPDVLQYAVERFIVGSVLNEKTLESRIKAGVKFFVTQFFPTTDELQIAKKVSESELFLLIGISDKKEDYIKLREKGFKVNENVIKFENTFEGIWSYYNEVADFLGRKPEIYLVPLTKEMNPKSIYEFIKNMQK